MKTNFLFCVIAALAAMVSGCTGPRAVVFVTGTHLGVEVNAVEGGQQTAHVGYRRAEAVIMPHSVKKSDGRNGDTYVVLKDAYPVLSSYEMSSGSLFIPAGSLTSTGAAAPLRINQVFATGDAAVIASKNNMVQTDFNRLAREVAGDDEAKLLQDWLTVPQPVRSEREKIINDFAKSKGVSRHNLLWKPENSAMRSEFITSQGGAASFKK